MDNESCNAGGALPEIQNKRLFKVSSIIAYAGTVLHPYNWMPLFLSNWIVNKMRWCPTCPTDLEEAEKKILSYVKNPYYTKYIEIDGNQKENYQIWTLSMNTENEQNKLPLVMVHGFASAVGLWVLNLDSLSKHRPLFAFDGLGFGRSSRPAFNKDGQEAENRLVQSIEEWRKQMNLQKFILLGHSMGGFLAASYAIQHSEHVAHLILADPWGFPQRPVSTTEHRTPPMRIRVIAALLRPFNPLAGLRIAGPWGPRLVEKFRPDLKNKFTSVIDDPDVVPNYIYHCNAQTPSGETALKSMTAHFGWAKNPMINRIGNIPSHVGITFIYGGQSWIDWKTGQEVKALRKNAPVSIHIIEGAGHHVYADQADMFNSLVQKVCRNVDISPSAVMEDTNCNNVDTNEQCEADTVITPSL